MTENTQPNLYYIGIGTLQPYISKQNSALMLWFGLPIYERSKPVLSDSKREYVTPIVDALNAGTMTEDQAKIELDKIWW